MNPTLTTFDKLVYFQEFCFANSAPFSIETVYYKFGERNYKARDEISGGQVGNPKTVVVRTQTILRDRSTLYRLGMGH